MKGEADYTLPELVSRLMNGKNPDVENLPGLVYSDPSTKEIIPGPQDEIVQELDSTRRKHPELDDKKLQIISKEEIKRMNGGKSPDYADVIMMRMYFELRPNYGTYAVG